MKHTKPIPKDNLYHLPESSHTANKKPSVRKAVIKIDPRVIEEHLWEVIEDVRQVNRILLQKRSEDQEVLDFSMDRLQLINAVSALQKELTAFDKKALNFLMKDK